MKNIFLTEEEFKLFLRNAFIQGEKYQENWSLEQIGEINEVTEKDFGEWYNGLELFQLPKTDKKIINDEYYLSTNDFVDSNDLQEEA